MWAPLRFQSPTLKREAHADDGLAMFFVRALALGVHDFVAHPLMTLTGESRMSMWLHDEACKAYDSAEPFRRRDVVYVRGSSSAVEPLVALFDSALRERFELSIHEDGDEVQLLFRTRRPGNPPPMKSRSRFDR